MPHTAATAGRSGRPWRTVHAQVYREETHCWLCRVWVDPALPRQHPYSRSVDHLVQLSHQGRPQTRTNLRLAHRRCNVIRGNKLRNLNPEQCACSRGQPCQRLTPKATAELSVDLATI
jgi:5-methylcytosine-specific restriction endonuclease McrA